MVNGSFVYPPPFGIAGDYSADVHVNLGSYMNITWSGGPSGLATLWLFKDGNELGTCTEFNLANTYCTPVLLAFQSEQSYEWLVQTYDVNYTSAKPWYYFVIHSDSTSQGFYSHYFNIDPPLSSTATSSIATATSTSRSTGTHTGLTTTSATSTSSPSSLPTSPPQTSKPPAGLTAGTKAAIGIAVGVGVPLILLLIYIAILLTRRRKAAATRPEPTSAYTNVNHTRYNPDGTTSEYVEAPHDSTYKPQGGYYQVQNPQSAGYKPGYQSVATSELSGEGRYGQAPMSELPGDNIRR